MKNIRFTTILVLWCTLYACTTELPIDEPITTVIPRNVWEGPPILYSFKMNDAAAWGEPFVSGDFMMSDYNNHTVENRYYYFLRTRLSTGEVLDSSAMGLYHVDTDAEHQTDDGSAVYASADTLYRWGIETGRKLKRKVRNVGNDYSESLGQAYFTVPSPSEVASSLCLIDNVTLDTNSIITISHPSDSKAERFSSMQKIVVDGVEFYYGLFSYIADDLSVPSAIFCYNIDERRMVWSEDFEPQVPNKNASQIGIYDSILIARSPWRARGYNLYTGEQLWEWDNDPFHSSAEMCPFMLGNGIAYWCTDGSSFMGGTYGLDILTGRLAYYEKEPVQGAVLDIKKFRDIYVVLDVGTGTIHRFDPQTGTYSNSFKSPNAGSFNQEFFNLSGFSIDELTGRLAINDTGNIYVFDISDW